MNGSFFLGAEGEKRFEVRPMQFGELGEHEVLIKVMACGVCGTDVHIYHGGAGSAPVVPPVVLGHEFAGIVEKIGAGVKDVCVGDHVALDPNQYCGKCRPCRMGKKQNCEHLYALGVNVNGGFAQYALAPEAQCFKVLPEIDFDVAAMAEPLACVLHGIDRAEIQPGQTVAVVGGGTIGLLMVQMAKLCGADRVVLSEPVEMRRNLAMKLGAFATIDPTAGDLAQKFKELTGLDGADVVIECVGKPFAATQAISLAGLGGMIMLFSVPPVGAEAPLPLFDVYKKELTIRGSIINPDTHLRAVQLINSQRLNIKDLITHVYGLNQLDEAIHSQMGNESIKVVVHPQE